MPEAVAASFYGRSRLPLASLRNSPNSRNPPLQLPGATQAAADLSCSSNKSLRPWQRLFMDVQGCRLPALKIPQTLPCSSQATQAAADLSCSSNKSLRPWQCPFKEVQGCRLPAFKTLKPSPAAPRRQSGRGRPFLQLQQVPEAVAVFFYGGPRLPFASLQNSAKLHKPSPAAHRRHLGRGRPFLQLQQVPEAVAASFYGRSRLPFASPQNSPNPSLHAP